MHMADAYVAVNRLQMNYARPAHFQKNWGYDKMTFNLKYKDQDLEKEIPNEDYTIKDLLNEMELSPQTIVSKQNGELVIEDTVIEDGDEIQLVQIIYGG